MSIDDTELQRILDYHCEPYEEGEELVPYGVTGRLAVELSRTREEMARMRADIVDSIRARDMEIGRLRGIIRSRLCPKHDLGGHDLGEEFVPRPEECFQCREEAGIE
jgi:hypothetical protein